jgi:hypothetical protein
MTNPEKARPIAVLPKALQAALMGEAGSQTQLRPVKGKAANRFYAGECGLSPTVIHAMRKEGHGERVMMGNGSNSGRIYFPIEILDRALALLEAAYAPKQ